MMSDIHDEAKDLACEWIDEIPDDMHLQTYTLAAGMLFCGLVGFLRIGEPEEANRIISDIFINIMNPPSLEDMQ